MRVLVQRSLNSNVKINKKVVVSIDSGYVLLVGFTSSDTTNIVDKMIEKILNLRIFSDSDGLMNLNLLDACGSILSISQFTLYADTTKGRRPSFVDAMKPDEASLLYDYFNNQIKNKGIHIETGQFGADMEVNIINDGPITIMLDSKELKF